MKILITGGAGFIGSNLAKKLIKRGHDLRILDNFSKQIHGNNQSLDSELDGVDLIIGDVRNKSVITQSLDDVNAVVHLAAETGTGQSMYQLEEYQHTNISGTLNIINHLLHNEHSVEKIIVASSRAIYGEGRYSCKKHGVIYPDERSEIEMSNGQFDHKCKLCNRNLEAEATPENARIAPLSFYGITKQVQEQIVTMYAKVLGISGYSLRYQNVYGPGQSLMNPYTGIMAIFSTLARNNQTIRIFEDGNESRDFVYIDDVIDATIKCLSPDMHGIESFNIGTGNPTSVYKVAESIINNLKKFLSGFGAIIETMKPEYHDKILAITSHLPHLIAYTIVGTATDLEDQTKHDVVRFSATGFRDFTRIASSDPIMWRDVFLNNKDAVLEMLQRFSEDLTYLQRAIRWSEGEKLEELFTKTREIRRSIIKEGQDI